MTPEYGDYRYFRSPVTDHFVLEDFYVMEGWKGISQPSSILIDMRAYSVQLRHMIDELQEKIVEVSQATYILQTPFDKLQKAQALSELTPGIMTQSAGVVSTLTLQNEFLIMGKRINNVDDVPTPTREIGTINLPDFPFPGQIWVGTIDIGTGKIRPTPTSYTPFTNEATFVLSEPYEGLSNAQSISELGSGILKASTGGLLKIAIGGIDYATLSQIEALEEQIDGILGSISAIEFELLTIQGQLLVIDGQIYTLEFAVSALQAEVLTITASIVATNARIDNLRLNSISSDADVSIGYKLTNVTDGSAPLDAVNYGQLQAAISGIPAGTVTLSGQVTGTGTVGSSITTTVVATLNQIPAPSADLSIALNKIINLAPGFASTDAANMGNIASAIASLVQSVSGTSGRVSSTGGVNPVLDLILTPVSAGTYTNTTLTVDGYGRLTAASSGTSPVISVSGTSGRISSTMGVNPVLDLVSTAVTPGTYTNSTLTVDGYGRLTAASSGTAPVTTISGTANQITVSGTTAATIGIATNPIIPGNSSITVPAGTTAQRPGSPANGMLRANSDLGRIEGYMSGSWYSFVPLQNVTQFCVLAGGASNAISSIGPGTSGQLLQSGGNAANPSYTSTPGSVTPLTSMAVGNLTMSGINISSSGNLQLSAISSGGVGIGTSGPSRMLQISRGAGNSVGGTVLVENTVGGTGASARIELNTYSINPIFDPCVRISAIDTGDASGDLLISIKPNGASSNTVVPRFGIYQAYIIMFAQYLRWDNSTRNRLITLYDGGNDHQYIGLGYNSGTMRYQVDTTSSQHVWYAGTSSSASNEIMRLTGGGNLLLPGTIFSDRPRASFSSYGGSSVTAMGTAGTYSMITFPTTGATVSTSLNFFSYITGSRFTYTGAQSVTVRISYNITAGTNGASGEITTFDIVAGKTSTLASRRIILASTYSMISISCVVTLSTNNYIELFVTHSVNSRNLTIYDVQWDII